MSLGLYRCKAVVADEHGVLADHERTEFGSAVGSMRLRGDGIRMEERSFLMFLGCQHALLFSSPSIHS